METIKIYVTEKRGPEVKIASKPSIYKCSGRSDSRVQQCGFKSAVCQVVASYVPDYVRHRKTI